LVVSTSAIDCLERLVSEMTCYGSSGTLNPTHSLTHHKLTADSCVLSRAGPSTHVLELLEQRKFRYFYQDCTCVTGIVMCYVCVFNCLDYLPRTFREYLYRPHGGLMMGGPKHKCLLFHCILCWCSVKTFLTVAFISWYIVH